MALPIMSEDGPSQGVHRDGDAVGVVLMPLKHRQEGGVQLECQLPRQGHTHKHQIQAPDGVVFSRFVWEEIRRQRGGAALVKGGGATLVKALTSKKICLLQPPTIPSAKATPTLTPRHHLLTTVVLSFDNVVEQRVHVTRDACSYGHLVSHLHRYTHTHT